MEPPSGAQAGVPSPLLPRASNCPPTSPRLLPPSPLPPHEILPPYSHFIRTCAFMYCILCYACNRNLFTASRQLRPWKLRAV